MSWAIVGHELLWEWFDNSVVTKERWNEVRAQVGQLLSDPAAGHKIDGRDVAPLDLFSDVYMLTVGTVAIVYGVHWKQQQIVLVSLLDLGVIDLT